MSHPPPTVRHWIPCTDILYSKAHPQRVTLYQILSNIDPAGDPPYPYQCHQLCLFALLSNGRGTGEIQVVIRRADDDIMVYRSPTWAIEFGDNPLAVMGLPIRIRDVVFDEPGLYSIELWFDGNLLEQRPLLCR